MEHDNKTLAEKYALPEQKKQTSFFVKNWDDIVAAALVCFTFLFVFIFSGVFPTKWSETRLVNATQKMKLPVLASFFSGDLSQKSGGDVNVSPPAKIIAPSPQFIGDEMLDPEQFTAKSIFVRDIRSGSVLFQKNPFEQRPMASITKLMSSLVILERNPDWTATTTVVSDALIDNHMYAGDTYTEEELWYASLVGSSNKAIFSLAEAVGISRESFADRMNQKAMELGMSHTSFVEPTGLDEGNISTAADIEKLLSAALDKKEIQDAVLTQEFTLYSNEREKTHHMWNTDWLLLGWIPHHFAHFLGGKTGYIDASLYNFTMRAGDENENYIDVVVLGADTHEGRFTEARDVAEWVFQNYKWPVTSKKTE
ncbi:MAG: hypothetical protein COV59_05615 [Candidatus Magasanikbacteria bacterium CG11_big_fil_rev_8_21_14_0_20_39_34]|uniref:Peptidase S11 D-alanyl-D-alanine carboxypeptidase A N-terminal domain-containing protein n=1 Tax=Candidatus Magasanikbacteria bacterium CG11_big_fil_rev_8_21_14_0_20_39_34 TaxID=1974653 RepID=A0A2H0N6A3_9BACT|nr:MAG: hypothetical protein COV59_05615 [Candidatus Magasanikbacteria bacterium CG11_big_fil_rev_8_21_14_0_20_39_34]